MKTSKLSLSVFKNLSHRNHEQGGQQIGYDWKQKFFCLMWYTSRKLFFLSFVLFKLVGVLEKTSVRSIIKDVKLRKLEKNK